LPRDVISDPVFLPVTFLIPLPFVERRERKCREESKRPKRKEIRKGEELLYIFLSSCRGTKGQEKEETKSVEIRYERGRRGSRERMKTRIHAVQVKQGTPKHSQ